MTTQHGPLHPRSGGAPPVSTLNKPTATLRCSAVSFTWLENGNLMNQRLLRPEAFCFNRFASIERSSHYAEGTKTSETHIPKPPFIRNITAMIKNQTNADSIRDNFLRKWIFQTFYGFPLCGWGAVGQVCLVVLGCHVHSQVDSDPSLLCTV